MNHCPKCGSQNTCAAPDEAPAWARVWTKCFACGKRWDCAGSAPKADADDDEIGEGAETPLPKRSGDDIVSLVMRLPRKSQATQQDERVEREGAVSAAPKNTRRRCQAVLECRGTQCLSSPCRDSEFCQRHQPKASTPTAPAIPAKRSNAPITLAEPTIVNATPRALELNGEAVTVLDSFIASLQSDLQVLHAAKEVMERHG